MTPLTTIADAELFLSQPGKIWLFKHSSTCPVSTAAYDEVAAFLAQQPMPLALVVVQEARPVSNWLATRLAYVHQSPQLFLVRDGAVVWHASHWGITVAAMTAARSK